MPPVSPTPPAHLRPRTRQGRWSPGSTGRGRVPSRPVPVGGQVRAGQHEAARIAGDDAVEPVRARRGADEDEQQLGLDHLGSAGRTVPQRQALQVVITVRCHHVGAGPDGDRVDVRDLLDEVVGHRAFQRGPADEHRHRARVPGQVDGGLAGRVGAADDEHVLPGAGRRLGQGGPVVDAAAGQFLNAGRGQLPVGDPGGQDDRVRVDPAAVGEPDAAGRAVDLQADRRRAR